MVQNGEWVRKNVMSHLSDAIPLYWQYALIAEEKLWHTGCAMKISILCLDG